MEVEYTRCLKCHQPVEKPPERWCSDCFYPGIDDDYQEFINLIEDGHRRVVAASLSGWEGVEDSHE